MYSFQVQVHYSKSFLLHQVWVFFMKCFIYRIQILLRHTSHIPDTLVGKSLLFSSASILKFRCGQHPASDLHQVPGDVETKLLDIRVIVKICLPDQIVDLPLPVGGGPGRGLDHGRRLHVRQLLDTSLTLHYVADLQGKVGVLVFLSNLINTKIFTIRKLTNI